jgi:hypothetical protein
MKKTVTGLLQMRQANRAAAQHLLINFFGMELLYDYGLWAAADQFNADDQSLIMNFGRHYVGYVLSGRYNTDRSLVYLSRLKVYLAAYLIAILSSLGILLHVFPWFLLTSNDGS